MIVLMFLIQMKFGLIIPMKTGVVSSRILRNMITMMKMTLVFLLKKQLMMTLWIFSLIFLSIETMSPMINMFHGKLGILFLLENLGDFWNFNIGFFKTKWTKCSFLQSDFTMKTELWTRTFCWKEI